MVEKNDSMWLIFFFFFFFFYVTYFLKHYYCLFWFLHGTCTLNARKKDKNASWCYCHQQAVRAKKGLPWLPSPFWSPGSILAFFRDRCWQAAFKKPGWKSLRVTLHAGLLFQRARNTSLLRIRASTGSGPNSLGFWINKDCPISPLCDLSTCVALGQKTQVPGIAPSYLACEKPWVSVPGPGQGQEGARGISSLELCELLRSSLHKMIQRRPLRSDSLSSIAALLPFGWVAMRISLYFCKPQFLHPCVVCCCYIWLFCDSKNCSLPGSFVHGILQAEILELVVIRFSRGSSQSRKEPKSPALQADSLLSEPPEQVTLLF